LAHAAALALTTGGVEALLMQEHWRRYLAKDGKSEWAARARRSCEMQMHLSAS